MGLLLSPFIVFVTALLLCGGGGGVVLCLLPSYQMHSIPSPKVNAFVMLVSSSLTTLGIVSKLHRHK